MLSIIIGIVIIAVLIFVGIEIKINDTIFSVIFVGVILSSLVIGLFYPAKGFTDWQLVKETELVTLSNSVASQGSGRMFYVSISADNVYSYRYEIESEFKTEGSKSYKVDTVSGDNVEEIEEANSSNNDCSGNVTPSFFVLELKPSLPIELVLKKQNLISEENSL